jgi:hypothetical protein
MSILNFLKKIKLPSFEDEFIVDPVDQEASPEHGRQMQILAAMHREKEARQEAGLNNGDSCHLWEEDDSDATLPGTSAYFIEHNL